MKLNAVIIFLHDDDGKLLLQHRTKDAERLPDLWAFFGGQIRKTETAEQAVTRETKEELGHTLKNPKFVRNIDRILPSGQVVNLHIFSEYFGGNKNSLQLLEGQGWGWFLEPELKSLKMTETDRNIARIVYDSLTEQE